MSADYAHQNFILLWHLTSWWLLLAFSCGFRSISLEKSCHTLEVKRSRSQPDLIFCSNILSSGHHSSQLAISYKIQYHIQQQHSTATEPTTKLSTIKGFSPFFLLYTPNIQDTSESQYSFKASILHSMTKSS